ncbi:hypothetical protein ONZ51_g6601 [Trametes cubensis]|uniref:C2H2-type domain-containing protein n=1 Tax=Trametes cubensis TaxID=1111947 RepID=A0AAD7TS80_9APHY|nr:hypothetical protein ONZ51_g6601 [Trametes cubensis]
MSTATYSLSALEEYERQIQALFQRSLSPSNAALPLNDDYANQSRVMGENLVASSSLLSVDYDAEETTQYHPDDLEAPPQPLPLSPLWASWLDLDSPTSGYTSDALVPRDSPSGHSNSSSSYYTAPDGASLHSVSFTEDTSAGSDAESMHILGSVHGDLSEAVNWITEDNDTAGRPVLHPQTSSATSVSILRKRRRLSDGAYSSDEEEKENLPFPSGPVASTSTSAVPGSSMPRRPKRLRTNATVHEPTLPDVAALSPALPLYTVMDSRSPSPQPPVETAAQPEVAGPICNLLTEIHDRCQYLLTYVRSVDQGHLKAHGKASLEDTGYRCTYPQCSHVYKKKGDRNKHILDKHWNYRFACDVAGCIHEYGRADELTRHKKSAHG